MSRCVVGHKTSRWHALPNDTIVLMFGFLSPSELCTTSLVSHQFRYLSSQDVLWSPHCARHFLKTEREGNKSFQQMYAHTAADWGRYIGIYAPIKSIWNELEGYLARAAPNIYRSLQPGVSDNELDTVASETNVELPDEMRCFWRMHNGQRLLGDHNVDQHYQGLFGGYEFHGYHVNQRLMTLSEIQELYNQLVATQSTQIEWISNCLPIIKSFNNDSIVFIVIADFDVRTAGQRVDFVRGQIVTHTDGLLTPLLLEHSLSRFISNYTVDLIANKFDITDQEEILRFPNDAACGSDVTTQHVRIRASGLFIPQRSTHQNPQDENSGLVYSFAHRIRISMDAQAPQSATCQVVNRHWSLADETGKVLTIIGPGVNGGYPVIQPGTYFEYCWCHSHQITRKGTIRGYLEMELSSTGDLFEVEVGQFALDVPEPTVKDICMK